MGVGVNACACVHVFHPQPMSAAAVTALTTSCHTVDKHSLHVCSPPMQPSSDRDDMNC